MVRGATFVVVCLAALGAPAMAGADARTAQAGVQARIVEGGTIRVMTPMAMPSVRGGASGAVFVGNMPSMGMNGQVGLGNGSLSVRRDPENDVEVTAPTSFTLVRAEGVSVVLKTSSRADYGLSSGDVLLGALLDGSAVSIDVGSRLWLASATASAPTSGTLVVVVQYN